MKVLSLLSVLISFVNLPIAKTNNIEWYARVLDTNIYLYQSPLDIIENNVYFIIEPTYFVKLLADENALFYKAEYANIFGYIKKSEVQVVKTKPKTPFLATNFRVFSSSSQQLRSSPDISVGSVNIITHIPIYCKDFVYLGKIYGEPAVIDRTNIWYYCKYSADKEYYGYIYSDGCDQLNIMKNNESVEYIDKPNFNLEVNTNLAIVEPDSYQFKILIAVICVPVAIFLFMIIKSNIILKLKKEKAKEVKPFFDL